MSNRDEGNVCAFKQVEDGVYDLDQWNKEYWDRLTFFLQETARREIIVQLTVWDKSDIGRPTDPWHAENNVNYSYKAREREADSPSPEETNNTERLERRQRYVDRLLYSYGSNFCYGKRE